MNRITTYPILWLSAVLLASTSCGEDRTGEYIALTQEDRWIEEQMQNIYLWYEDMPTMEDEDYFEDPETFFEGLLSTSCRDGAGDSFSYFEDTSSTSSSTSSSLYIDETSSYGFDFILYSDPTGTTAHRMARVLYVIPDSPAEDAGLKRGDWITQIDGTNLSSDSYSSLRQGSAITLTIDSLIYTTEEDETVLSWYGESTLSLAASEAVSSNPFYKTAVFQDDAGHIIGYLMYDHYAPGVSDSSTEYNEEMKEIFASFKSAGVNEFILDLRYNPGGVMSCITQLCSYLAPAESLGQPLYSLEYNDKNSSLNSTSYLDEEMATENLGISSLYVITGTYTASASKTTIYCLEPYMTVNVIGATTVGKNVASVGLVSSYDFTLHPIVATVYNCNGESDYEDGITPDYVYNELTNYYPLGEIGDPDSDALLGYAIQWIQNGSLETTSASVKQLKSVHATELPSPLFSTLTYKKVQGNIITE